MPLSHVEAAKLVDELSVHDIERGGVLCGIFGRMGSAKTTLLSTLSKKVAYINPEDDKPYLETVIWRGRHPVDYFLSMPPERTVTLWLHESDSIQFFNERGRQYAESELPPILRYKDCYDLLSRLRWGGVNVVYEPRNYVLPETIKTVISRKIFEKVSYFDGDADPALFWFELIALLLVKKRLNKFISVFIDEAYEVFPHTSSQIRWHLQDFLNYKLLDIRKCLISLYLTAHQTWHLDPFLSSSLQYRIYLRGSTVARNSLITNKGLPISLPKGQGIIEGGLFGQFEFSRLPTFKRIGVRFVLPDEHLLGKSEPCTQPPLDQRTAGLLPTPSTESTVEETIMPSPSAAR
ncbi:MAG: hypothetical protein EHJ95_00270 [Methanobacteriota archaeon]|nr:MAG: hypothetical protein EHJ95_00270 [Euryarchaeota archaeon]